ncbi:MAG: 50S ribosome-binding GTPase [Planctomycetaceae bacterium]|nr:50S ribosome-binding GTPase [Planctomycetaceae bacterium]
MERELAEINKLKEIIEQYKTLVQTPKITESNASKVTADFINSEQLKSLLVPHDYQLESKLLSSSIDETHSTSCIDNEKQLEHLQSQLRERQNRLEENRLIGRHLIKPFRVVLSGDVNVGKSSLFNAILGYNRAITSSTPGTTRDVVVAQTAVDGFPVEFYDTAGIREVDKNIEKNNIEHEGIKRSIEQIAEADLIIRVVDLTSEIVNDFNLSSGIIVTKNSDSLNIVTKNILTCYNKADLVSDLPDEICVSAKTGLGVAELMEKIARILIPNPPRPFEAVPLI